MNIFYLDSDIDKCVEYHCDKHVVKMVLETAQLMCSVMHLYNIDDVPYKLTHKNHPCAIWARSSEGNFKWLISFGLRLCEEYTKRYNKIHKSQLVIEWCAKHMPELPDIPFIEPPKCMPDEYKKSNVVDSYRNYYMTEKAYMANWRYSKTPDWWNK